MLSSVFILDKSQTVFISYLVILLFSLPIINKYFPSVLISISNGSISSLLTLTELPENITVFMISIGSSKLYCLTFLVSPSKIYIKG